ncbi:hypothetical protein BV917_03395 [Leptospira santarosai serovar Guaricura]|nr:hypothetical protein BV917_03395 [Leptospira santarosai serovar Guaricura]
MYDGIELLKNRQNGTKLHADSAYSNCDEFMKKLKKKNLVDKICFKGYRNKPFIDLESSFKKFTQSFAKSSNNKTIIG